MGYKKGRSIVMLWWISLQICQKDYEQEQIYAKFHLTPSIRHLHHVYHQVTCNQSFNAYALLFSFSSLLLSPLSVLR